MDNSKWSFGVKIPTIDKPVLLSLEQLTKLYAQLGNLIPKAQEIIEKTKGI